MRENKTMGIIFSNMHDSMLGALTEVRTTGSVPFGARYRFIDFVLSSMVNSDIQDIGIITKSNYRSLMDHVGAGGIGILPASAAAWCCCRRLQVQPGMASIGAGWKHWPVHRDISGITMRSMSCFATATSLRMSTCAT